MKKLSLILILFSCSSLKHNKIADLKRHKERNFINGIRSEICFSENNKRYFYSSDISNNGLYLGNVYFPSTNESTSTTYNSLTIANNSLSFNNSNLVGNVQANGYLTLNIEYYNVHEEVRPGKPYAGQIYRLYAYSEGIIGLLKSNDIVGIRIKVTNQSPEDAKLASITMKVDASNLLLANSRFLSNNQNSTTNIGAYEVAKWVVQNSAQRDLKGKFKIEIIGIFGNGTTDIKSAQRYLGALEFYLVRENENSNLNTQDILNAQLNEFINNSAIYNKISGEQGMPYNFQIHSSSTPQNITIKLNNGSYTVTNAKLSGGVIVAPNGNYFGYPYIRAIIKHNTQDYTKFDIQGFTSETTVHSATYKKQ